MTSSVLFHVFAQEYLSTCKKSDLYKQSLSNAVKHLTLFSTTYQIPIFTNLNEQMMENFAFYLREQNLRPSTVKNNISRIKYLVKKHGKQVMR